MRSHWIKVGPKSKDWCPPKKRKRKHKQGRSPGDNRGRDWNDTATNQGTGIAGSHQKLGKGKEELFPRALAGVWPCQHLDFTLLASRTMKEYISVVSCHPLCDKLLCQP